MEFGCGDALDSDGSIVPEEGTDALRIDREGIAIINADDACGRISGFAQEIACG